MALVLERVEALLGDTQKVRLVDLQMVRLNDCTVERFGEQLPAHLFFEWRMPQGWDWLFLLMVGTLSQLGQVFLTRALQSEAVAGVAIINYTGLVYAISVGWIIFGEPQTIWSLTGMVVVVSSVLMSVMYGRRRQRLAAIETTAA